MSRQSHHSALDVPEILLTVGSFMTRDALASSLRVSQYFHQTLEPLVFTHLHLVYDKTRRPTPALVQSRHLHRVRHLYSTFYISVDYLSLAFRNLVSINLKGFIYRGSYEYEDDEAADPAQVGTREEIMNALRTLISENPGLRRWTIREPVPQLTQDVWQALAQPTESQNDQQKDVRTEGDTVINTKDTGPRLDMLDVSSTIIDYESAPFFFAVCRAAKNLRLERCTMDALGDNCQLCIPPTHAAGPYFPLSVEFGDIIGLAVLAQLEFLVQCHNVQKIHWHSTTRSSHYAKHYVMVAQDKGISKNQPLPDTDDIRRLVQPGTWMHLRSLVVSGQYDPYGGKLLEFIQDEGFAHILESIPAQQLVELECHGTAIGPLGFEALKRHCDSLRLLAITRSSGFTSGLAQETLESFPKLTSLQVERLSVEDIERGGPWACLNLRILAAQFDMGGAINTEDDQRRHRQVFERIATLAGLEKLTVGAVGADKVPRLQFRITHGLDALSSLKSLYFLSVVETNQRLEVPHVRWMIDTWPSLRIVAGSLYYDDKDQNRLLKELFIKHNITLKYYE